MLTYYHLSVKNPPSSKPQTKYFVSLLKENVSLSFAALELIKPGYLGQSILFSFSAIILKLS